MDSAAQVLLIIVSAVLSVFLILLALAAIYMIQVLRRVREIVERAENVAGTMEAAARTFEKTAGPIAIIKLISNIVSAVSGRKKGK